MADFDPLTAPAERLRQVNVGWSAYGNDAPMRVRFYWGEMVDQTRTLAKMKAEGIRDPLGLRGLADRKLTEADAEMAAVQLLRASQAPRFEPVTERVPMIEIGQAGGRSTRKRRATRADVAQWPQEWAAFQAEPKPRQRVAAGSLKVVA